MELALNLDYQEDLKGIFEKKGNEEAVKVFQQKRWGGREGKPYTYEFHRKAWTTETLSTLKEYCQEKGDRAAVRDINMSIKLIEASKGVKISKLSQLKNAFRQLIEDNLIKGWLFHRSTGLPSLVTSIEYSPKSERSDAYISVTLLNLHGENRSIITVYSHEAMGLDAYTILANKGYIPETQELIDSHTHECELFTQYIPLYSTQFQVTGTTKASTGKYNRPTTIPAGRKLIQDVSEPKSTYTGFDRGYFWAKGEDYDLNLGDPHTEVPLHPYICFFDLEEHEHINLLPSQVKIYEYKPELREKIVLPDIQKELLDILVHDFDVIRSDIVEGKSGGTFVLCKGSAGLGKTLTAEIYSEVIKKPLYRVHSGQLGVDPKDVEKRLKEILKRMEDWGAIGLLDECDTYVRRRGDDIHQNAVVAAFLRQLEYHNSMIFMTTNRSNDVDEAIESRAAAIILYENPTDAQSKQLWAIQGENFGFDFSEDEIKELMRGLPQIAGRDIKMLLNLASRYRTAKPDLTNIELIKTCSSFRGLSYSN